MTDGEKVVEAIENCINDGYCYSCKYKQHMACKTFALRDAIKLLKEQTDEIKELRSMVEFWKDKALHT